MTWQQVATYALGIGGIVAASLLIQDPTTRTLLQTACGGMLAAARGVNQ